MRTSPSRAISVSQPWAWMIAYGGKTVENRTWTTHYRGPVAIHASATIRTRDARFLRDNGIALPRHMDTNAIVAVANLDDVHIADRCGCVSVWAEPGPGVHHWLLNDVTAIDPVRCVGGQQLWTLPTSIRGAISTSLQLQPTT